MAAPRVAPMAAPTVAPMAAPAERSISEQSFHSDLRDFGNNLYASSFDGQGTSSARNEQNEAQSAPSEGGSGRKRKQSHIGSALEDYVEFKKSQTSKTLEALNEKKKRAEEFCFEKCADQVDSINELTNDEKSYAMELFESDTNREVFMKTKNPEVRLIWLKRKIRYVLYTVQLYFGAACTCSCIHGSMDDTAMAVHAFSFLCLDYLNA